MTFVPSIPALTDRELIVEVKRLAVAERHETAALIAVLAEIDARRLYLGERCSSLFTYCTEVLHLSEHAAYGRIEAARTSRRFPCVLRMIADGDVTLTSMSLVAPHLTPANHCSVLESIRHKSKREVERIVAALAPKPDAPTVIRRLPAAPCPTAPLMPPAHEPAASVASPVQAPAPRIQATPSRSRIAPLSPERFKLQFTMSAATHDKLRRAQDLLRHSIPSGDPAAIVDRALSLLLEHLERTKLAQTDRPRAPGAGRQTGRHIAAAVRREVWRRDGRRCAFVGTEGRCGERGFLELHHVVPYALGGSSTVENIQLRCRAHNQYEADLLFPVCHASTSDNPG
jgi:hypothetical protein